MLTNTENKRTCIYCIQSFCDVAFAMLVFSFSLAEAIMSRKRPRLHIHQWIALEQSFANNAGLTKDRVMNVSQTLGLHEQTVWNCFLKKRQSSSKCKFVHHYVCVFHKHVYM